MTGSWYWLSNTSLHYRPQTYWPANSAITVRMSLRGVPFGNGVYGEQDRVVSFRTGDAMISTVDVAGHQMTVTQNGQPLRTIPVTTGKPGQATRAGIKIISEKYVDKRMDAATTGVDSTDPDYYVVDVKYAMRVTNTGEFVHAAPWSVGLAGQRQREPRVHWHEHRERPLVVRDQSTRRRRRVRQLRSTARTRQRHHRLERAVGPVDARLSAVARVARGTPVVRACSG